MGSVLGLLAFLIFILAELLLTSKAELQLVMSKADELCWSIAYHRCQANAEHFANVEEYKCS